MQFEWDDAKEIANRRKHGFSFRQASMVFDDPLMVLVEDRVEDGEQRWHALGLIDGMTLLLVVHSWRDDSGADIVRIISARRATRIERRRYENGDR
jgi:uncharacterized protein